MTPSYVPNKVEIAKRFPKMTPEAIDEIIKYYKESDEDEIQLGELALAYGISHSQLIRLLSEYGYKAHKRYTTYHQEQLLKVLEGQNINSPEELLDRLYD